MISSPERKGDKIRHTKRTFRTVPAPFILFAPRIAASENIVILLQAGENPGNLKLAQGSQQAEIVSAPRQVSAGVLVKILFKFKAFGVLVVYAASGNRALVSAGLIGQSHIVQIQNRRSNQGGKRHQGGKWGVAVEIPLAVQFQHPPIQGAFYLHHLPL